MSITLGITERAVEATPAGLGKFVNDQLLPLLKQLRDEINALSGGGATPSGPAGGDLAGTYPDPEVAAVHETSGPTQLTIDAIADGEFLKRDGATIVGDTPTATGAAGGDLSGTYPNPTVAALHETGGPQKLTVAGIAANTFVKRNGSNQLVGDGSVITGSGANQQVAVFNGAQTISSGTGLVYDGSIFESVNGHVVAGRNIKLGNVFSTSTQYLLWGSGSDVRMEGTYDAGTAANNKLVIQIWNGGAYEDALVHDSPATTLHTGAKLLVNVAGTKTTPRVMMGPADNVGKTFVVDSFNGAIGAGAITATNLLAGDVVISLVGVGGVVGDQSGNFEATISVNGQIQQTSGAVLTLNTYLVLVERYSATGATTERPLYVVP